MDVAHARSVLIDGLADRGALAFALINQEYIHNEQQAYLLRDAALSVLRGEQAISFKPADLP